MLLFYAKEINNNYCILDERESRHCIRVLKMGKGDKIRLTDGKGNLYEGIISDPDRKRCQVTITNKTEDNNRRNYRLHIAISPLKNYERFEWFVEKSVEIGIDEITPLICDKTEKESIRTERINNIIISAMTQSLKSSATILNKECLFNDFLEKPHTGVLMIAHCNYGSLKNGISKIYSRGKDAVILVGPEGDFAEEEIKNANNKGFRPVHLGQSRLRTETAGIAACHSIYLLNQ